MKISRLFALGATASLCLTSMVAAAPDTKLPSVPPAKALQLLLDGNKRYREGHPRQGQQDAARRDTVAKGQRPFAIIVGCSDSRVPAEIVFDQGLGDLFGVRTAGEVVDNAELGSMEYAVEHLGAELIVVLGHERCGAVDAATKGGHAPGHIGSLITAIAPAVESVRHQPGSLLHNSIQANVKMVVSHLRMSSPILRQHVDKGTLQIVGADYDLETGEVKVIPVTANDVKYWSRPMEKKHSHH